MRTSASAASVPRMVARHAVMNAMRMLTQAACRIAELSSSERYQRSDQPPQTATILESLNE